MRRPLQAHGALCTALAARLLLEGAKPENIESQLRRLAQDMGVPGYDTTYGWGYLEVLHENQQN